jgi:hypothetical protein
MLVNFIDITSGFVSLYANQSIYGDTGGIAPGVWGGAIMHDIFASLAALDGRHIRNIADDSRVYDENFRTRGTNNIQSARREMLYIASNGYVQHGLIMLNNQAQVVEINDFNRRAWRGSNFPNDRPELTNPNHNQTTHAVAGRINANILSMMNALGTSSQTQNLFNWGTENVLSETNFNFEHNLFRTLGLITEELVTNSYLANNIAQILQAI